MSYLFYLKTLRNSKFIDLLKFLNTNRQSIQCFKSFFRPKINLNINSKLNPKLRDNKSIVTQKSFKGNTLWSWDIIPALLIWLGIIDDYENTEDPLILTIKRGVYCMQCEEYEKAEMILHSALQMAQDLSFEQAQIYIYDILANNYFKKKDFKRAEQLFAAVFSSLLNKGMEVNDESIIELSVKLSHIYSVSGDFEKCNKGFDFCLTEQNKRIKDFADKDTKDLTDEEINSLALMGMCYDYYAQHLSSIGQFDKSIDTYKTALNICLKINGETHPQTLVLLNDMSATFVHKKDYENGLNYMKKAIDGAVRSEDKNLANFYYNIGSIYLLQLNKEWALKSCKRSLALSLQSSDKSLEEKARNCIGQSSH